MIVRLFAAWLAGLQCNVPVMPKRKALKERKYYDEVKNYWRTLYIV